MDLVTLQENASNPENSLQVLSNDQNMNVKLHLLSSEDSEEQCFESNTFSSTDKDNSNSLTHEEGLKAINEISKMEVTASRAGTKKIKKMKHLPGFPKRSQSAFFYWLNENREKLKDTYPNIVGEEFFMKSQEMWNDVEDKTKWNNEADEDRKRYNDNLEKWKAKVERKSKVSFCNKMSSDLAKKKEPGTPCKPRNCPLRSNSNTYKSSMSWYGSGSAFKSKEFIDIDSSDEDEINEELCLCINNGKNRYTENDIQPNCDKENDSNALVFECAVPANDKAT